jgi:hypothetical protein
MYISRLNFYTLPGKTREVEEKLGNLLDMVVKVGGMRTKVLRTHFASPGVADVVFEQEAPDLATLEAQIKHVTENPEFQKWTGQMSGLLSRSPKREVYCVVNPQ